jgi:hypothetical protein
MESLRRAAGAVFSLMFSVVIRVKPEPAWNNGTAIGWFEGFGFV